MSEGDMPRGGRGLMDMVQFFGQLGGGPAAKSQSGMVVISGDVCIQSGPQQPAYDKRKMRRLAFNESNDLHKPPDSQYIKTLPRKFPGTILSMRFHLNPDYLEAISGG